MSKYRTYDERNRNGCCAKTSCEAKLDPEDTWNNSLNNNKYCGKCKDWLNNNFDRFSVRAPIRRWTRVSPGAS